MLRGLMMDDPLTLPHILERSAKLYARQEIASRGLDGSMHRYTYRDFHARTHRLAHVLRSLGLQPGERVATLCWNSFRHLELYFAVPCSGGVLHTLNLRLAPEQLAYVMNHAEDAVVFVDASLLPVFEAVCARLTSLRHLVVMNDTGQRLAAGLLDYEALLAAAPGVPFAWPKLDERTAAAMCYTSGTTGNPKGVLYDHRSIFLHSYAICMADAFALSERDTILQMVPMFHANGWGVPYAGVMTGARFVFSGRNLQPSDIAWLIEHERPSFSAGVPTLWMNLCAYLESHPCDLSSLKRVVVAGSAMPQRFIELFEQRHKVRLLLAWGMTETTPIATVTTLKKHIEESPAAERYRMMARHGLPLPGVELRLIRDEGEQKGSEAPWDGTTMGELQVRGPWVCSAYYKTGPAPEAFADGWLRTGDIATIDPEGYIEITDRAKDLVKSGGEWISSVDLENIIMEHPKVQEATVIAVFHPKWHERPLACVVSRPEYRGKLAKQEILDFLKGRVAKWWLPDDVVFLDEVPKTSVGKFNKRALREQFKNYPLPARDA